MVTIKTLNELNRNSNEIYEELYKLILSEYASKSELNCFLNACDLTIKIVKDDFFTFKMAVDLYLKYRDLTNIVPSEWIQAIIDKGASRSKGNIGEKKLVEIAIKNGFMEVNSWKDFNEKNRVVARFKKNIFDIQEIENRLNIKLEFNNDKKMLDVIIKSNNFYCFIEAKHLKEGGGEQDKQINELIKIIENKPSSNNVVYGAFLDGIYSNVLLYDLNGNNIKNCELIENKNNTKIINQKISIVKALNKNPTSFWFNTAGFENFIRDFNL